MNVAQRISEAEYEQIVLAEPIETWELHDGRLVEKPGATWEAGSVQSQLCFLLLSQLDRREFHAFAGARVRQPGSIFRPDVCVVPTSFGEAFRSRPDKLAIFADSLTLIVEVWMLPTVDYDVDTKIPVYQQRGDLEIWRIHPYERTLTRWTRQADGTYEETVHRGGVVRPVALPGVKITLDELFDD
jgi:Uma2 family endonuclease